MHHRSLLLNDLLCRSHSNVCDKSTKVGEHDTDSDGDYDSADDQLLVLKLKDDDDDADTDTDLDITNGFIRLPFLDFSLCDPDS